MNEARSEEKLKQKSLTKSEDSGHDSGQSSLNTGSAGSESFSESSGWEKEKKCSIKRPPSQYNTDSNIVFVKIN